MEITGRIKMIGLIQEITPTFRKRELVVTTEEQYPQTLMIEFHQDKTDLLNNYQLGQQVRVNINLRGREWVNPQGQTKYFNSIQGWRIEPLQAQPPQPQQGYDGGYPPQGQPQNNQPYSGGQHPQQNHQHQLENNIQHQQNQMFDSYGRAEEQPDDLPF